MFLLQPETKHVMEKSYSERFAELQQRLADYSRALALPSVRPQPTTNSESYLVSWLGDATKFSELDLEGKGFASVAEEVGSLNRFPQLQRIAILAMMLAATSDIESYNGWTSGNWLCLNLGVIPFSESIASLDALTDQELLFLYEFLALWGEAHIVFDVQPVSSEFQQALVRDELEARNVQK